MTIRKKRIDIRQLLAAGNYYQVPKTVAQVFGSEFTLVLSCYLDAHLYWERQQEINDINYKGWFVCTIEAIGAQLNMSSRKVLNYKKKLEERKIIITKRITSTQLVRVSPRAVLSLIEEAQQYPAVTEKLKNDFAKTHKIIHGTHPTTIPKRGVKNAGLNDAKNAGLMMQKTQDYTNTITKRNSLKKKIVTKRVGDKKSPSSLFSEKDLPYIPLLEDLVELRKRVFQYNTSDRQKKIWIGQLRLLNTVDGISLERIEDAMDWYCKGTNSQLMYTPNATKGEYFREKFEKLESQIKRIKTDGKKTSTAKNHIRQTGASTKPKKGWEDV
jgi:hypothetical protein